MHATDRITSDAASTTAENVVDDVVAYVCMAGHVDEDGFVTSGVPKRRRQRKPKVTPAATTTFNLSGAKHFTADFDTDEDDDYIPKTKNAVIESAVTGTTSGASGKKVRWGRRVPEDVFVEFIDVAGEEYCWDDLQPAHGTGIQGWKKEVPGFSFSHLCFTPEGIQKRYDTAVGNLGIARREALDLANGIGRLREEKELLGLQCVTWEGVPQFHMNDDRRPPLIWRAGRCLNVAEYTDGYASYGRATKVGDFCPKIFTGIERQQGIDCYRARWHDFHHIGDVPCLHVVPEITTRGAPDIFFNDKFKNEDVATISPHGVTSGVVGTPDVNCSVGWTIDEDSSTSATLGTTSGAEKTPSDAWLASQNPYPNPSTTSTTSSSTEITTSKRRRGKRISKLTSDLGTTSGAEDIASVKRTSTKTCSSKFACPSRSKETGSAGIVDFWIQDTGAFHDIVAEEDVEDLRRLFVRERVPMSFETARGTTPDATHTVPLRMEELNETFWPRILRTTTPALMSVGRRCVDLGYDFIWLGSRGLPPYWVTPTGEIVQCGVDHGVPYITPGSSTSQPKRPTTRLNVKSFALPSALVPGGSRRPFAVTSTDVLPWWIADTGSTHDLICAADVYPFLDSWEYMGLEATVKLHTPNGESSLCTHTVKMHNPEMNETFNPIIVNSECPALLSVGTRCEKLGYDFIWLGSRGIDPYWVLPNGDIVVLDVYKYLPYLCPGSERSAPRKPTCTVSVPCCVAMASNGGDERVDIPSYDCGVAGTTSGASDVAVDGGTASGAPSHGHES